jgi:hypothetical protein
MGVMEQVSPLVSNGLTPSLGTPGEGWGGGSDGDAHLLNPLPDPPPEYRGREARAAFTP